MIEKVIIWEDGKKQIFDKESNKNKKIIKDILMGILQQINVQARCVITQELIKEIKRKDKAIEFFFKRPENITIAQLVPQEERDYIQTDEKGYRILNNIKRVIFILGDKPTQALKNHVLLGLEFKKNVTYSCWILEQKVSDQLKELINKLHKN